MFFSLPGRRFSVALSSSLRICGLLMITKPPRQHVAIQNREKQSSKRSIMPCLFVLPAGIILATSIPPSPPLPPPSLCHSVARRTKPHPRTQSRYEQTPGLCPDPTGRRYRDVFLSFLRLLPGAEPSAHGWRVPRIRMWCDRPVNPVGPYISSGERV
ncbi:hypothetical protein MPH_04619 [Macrophomina phaseolina MS6]|uniref:Uncharacterized protein n=1 Tax=Macrophomina phaseolina (strain MS6) TaxID=1126212 RepID=K2RZF8_MACPH|nr:hypothetical protein MPH_04619 [Macrophomina phaseolina MS6]